MSEMIVSNYQRGIAEVTRDIRIKTGQFLMDAIEIGRLLFEAKAMVDPGGWMQYVAEELPFSHSWANNYMRLYKELGGEQISLFGNSQALANLSPTQALELLALPAQERDEFVQTHDVENMSTRELHQAIRERDEALQAQQDAERAQADAEERAEQQKEAAKRAEEEAERLRAAIAKAQAEQTAAAQKLEKLQKQVAKAKENEKAAQEALAKAKENPDVPEAVMEQLRQEVAATAAQKATEDLQKQLNAAEQQVAAATAKAQEVEQKLAAAQKAVKLSNPETAVFQALSNRLVDEFNRVHGQLLKVQQSDPDTGSKLQIAILDTIDKMRVMIAGS